MLLVRAALILLSTAPDSSYTCRVLVDHLQDKIEADYAGYLLEVRNTSRRASYQAQLRALDALADTTPPARCYPLLNSLVTWFDDPHLFVYQSARLDSTESRRRGGLVVHRNLDEQSARAYFAVAHSLDPIEGIWHDGPTRFAVVRDSTAAGRFEAVLLDPDSTTWRPGDVRAAFRARSAGQYDGTVWLTNFAMRELNVTLHRRSLLRFSPGMWGKVYPLSPADSGVLDPVDVHRPTVVVRGTTVIVSIPSHDPGFRPHFDSLISAHDQDLRNATVLVVDLRGNEGGSSGMSNGLAPYLASAHLKPDPLHFHRACMLSSPDQIAYASRAFGSDTTAFVKGLLERLRAAPGGLVPLSDPAEPAETTEPAPPVFGTARVAILIDRGTVSASEVLVAEAKRSERVTVFGEPTAGALDYQSIQIVAIAPDEHRWFLGYPTITASADLPRGGIRGKGIPPDVRLDWNRIADPIAEVERLLGHR